MYANSVYIHIDSFFIKQFKDKFNQIEAIDHVKVGGKREVGNVDISGKLVVLQAHYWPSIRTKLEGAGVLILLGRLSHFYSWMEAIRKYPSAYCSPFDSLNFIDRSFKYVNKGNHYLSKNIALWLEKSAKEKQEYLLNRNIDKHLTMSELKVLNLISEGRKSTEIAKFLHRSIHTINTHRKNIRKKLKLRGKMRLSIFAAQNKFAFKTLFEIEKRAEIWQAVLKNTF